MSISAGELSTLLEQRISNYYTQLNVDEIGSELSEDKYDYDTDEEK